MQHPKRSTAAAAMCAAGERSHCSLHTLSILYLANMSSEINVSRVYSFFPISLSFFIYNQTQWFRCRSAKCHRYRSTGIRIEISNEINIHRYHNIIIIESRAGASNMA